MRSARSCWLRKITFHPETAKSNAVISAEIIEWMIHSSQLRAGGNAIDTSDSSRHVRDAILRTPENRVATCMSLRSGMYRAQNNLLRYPSGFLPGLYPEEVLLRVLKSAWVPFIWPTSGGMGRRFSFFRAEMRGLCPLRRLTELPQDISLIAEDPSHTGAACHLFHEASSLTDVTAEFAVITLIHGDGVEGSGGHGAKDEFWSMSIGPPATPSMVSSRYDGMMIRRRRAEQLGIEWVVARFPM